MEILLTQLDVMQNSLRQVDDHLTSMIEYVKQGGLWTVEQIKAHYNENGGATPALICVTRFEDGAMRIHDGHHRTVATLLGGRSVLYPEEYFFRDMTYELYLSPNFNANFYTPFDPRSEVRVSDFFDFKNDVAQMLSDNVPEEEIVRFIFENKNRYCTPKTVANLEDLANKVQQVRNVHV